MGRRVGEFIDNHVQRARVHVSKQTRKITASAHSVKNKVKDHPAAPWILVLLTTLTVLFLTIAILYLNEEAKVRASQPSEPLSCDKLLFSGNKQLCATILTDYYQALPPLERGVLCDRKKDRRQYGSAATVCGDYDNALRTALYEESTVQRGVAPWESDKDIVTDTLHVKTMQKALSVTLVCNGVFVPTKTLSQEQTITTLYITQPVNGTCILIAVVAEGSVTSAPFSLLRE